VKIIIAKKVRLLRTSLHAHYQHKMFAEKCAFDF